jgi:hypothetical protein
MARLADIDDIALTDLHAELRCREEESYRRHRGHRILTGDGLATVKSPGPRLRALRAGRPVEILDWQLPRWARSGTVENRRVRVHPDGRVVDAG